MTLLLTHFLVLFNFVLQVIEVNLTSENPTPVAEGAALEFTYSVNWYPTNIAFEDRFRKYLDKSFFEHQVPFVCFPVSFSEMSAFRYTGSQFSTLS